MKIATADALFAIIRKSGLLTPEEIEEARAATQTSDGPQSIGAHLARTGQLTEWQVRKLLAGQHALFLGKYKLLDRLEWGDSGRVYLAEHTRMRNRVALKTLGRRMSKDSRTLELFKNEGRTAASLDHQNIIKVYDFDFESDYYFFVMEFVEGRDLQRAVQADGRLAPHLAAGYVRQAALGLAHAHAKKIYHGDLKPANLLVDARGGLKIIDLGASRMPRSDEEQASAGNQYLPPEQELASDPIDHLADIYALGGTLYFLLTGEPPLKHGTSSQRLAEHRGRNLRQTLKDVPEPLFEICAKMMAEKPADRFQSADEVAQALQKWLDETRKSSEPAQSRGDRPRPRTRVQSPASESSEFPALAPAKAATETLDFAIDVQPRRKKKKTAADRVAERAAAKATEAKPVEAAQKSSATKWIVVGVGTTVALVAAVVLAIVLWPSADDAVAKKGDAKQGEAAAAEDPEAIENAKAAEGEGEDEPEGDDETPNATEDEDDEKTPDKSDPEKSPPEDDTKVALVPPKTEPEKTDPPKAEPAKPEVPATTPTPPAEPPKAEPPPPPPPKKPFVNFTKAIAIPELAEGAAGGSGKAPAMMVLGTVADKADIQIDLLGGDESIAGKPKFDMASAGDAGWTITLLDGVKAEGKPVHVADVSYNKETGEVMFQWANTALPHREANFLRNCILNLRAGTDSLPLSLRTPSECPPLVITDKPKIKASFTVPFLPDPKLVQVELTTLEGTFPPHKFDPGAAMLASKGIVKIRLGKDEQFLALEVTSRMTRSIDLTLSPTVQFPGQEKAVPMMLAKSAEPLQKAMMLSEQLTKMVAQGASIPLADVNGRARLEKMTAELAKYEKAIPQLQAFDTDCKSLPGGKIHLRVIYKIDDQTVELASSEVGLSGAAGGAPASVFDKVK